MNVVRAVFAFSVLGWAFYLAGCWTFTKISVCVWQDLEVQPSPGAWWKYYISAKTLCTHFEGSQLRVKRPGWRSAPRNLTLAQVTKFKYFWVFSVCSNAGAVLEHCGEERAELAGALAERTRSQASWHQKGASWGGSSIWSGRPPSQVFRHVQQGEDMGVGPGPHIPGGGKFPANQSPISWTSGRTENGSGLNRHLSRSVRI